MTVVLQLRGGRWPTPWAGELGAGHKKCKGLRKLNVSSKKKKKVYE